MKKKQQQQQISDPYNSNSISTSTFPHSPHSLLSRIEEKLRNKSKREVEEYWAVVGADQKRIFDDVIARGRGLSDFSDESMPDEYHNESDSHRRSKARSTNHHKKIKVDSWRDVMRKIVISTKFQVSRSYLG